MNNQIVWHDIVDELPPESGNYLITCGALGYRDVDISFWDKEQNFWYIKSGVYAWAELPKPYKKGAQE